jgi:hypothetical protein
MVKKQKSLGVNRRCPRWGKREDALQERKGARDRRGWARIFDKFRSPLCQSVFLCGLVRLALKGLKTPKRAKRTQSIEPSGFRSYRHGQKTKIFRG